MEVFHPADARHEGHECPDDGYEARQYDRFTPMFFVKFMRAFQVFFIEQPHVLIGEYLRANLVSDPIIDIIADNRRGGKNNYHQLQFEGTDCGQGPCCEKKRIAGEKRGDYQTRFTEYYNEKNQIGPVSEVQYDDIQVFVYMKYDIEQL
jgi:hypothetical protein